MTRHLSRLPVTIGKTPILLAVICFNFLFVGVDVLMAHSENNVFRWALIPVVYSPLAVLAIAALLVFRHSVVLRRVFTAVMWGTKAGGPCNSAIRRHRSLSGSRAPVSVGKRHPPTSRATSSRCTTHVGAIHSPQV